MMLKIKCHKWNQCTDQCEVRDKTYQCDEACDVSLNYEWLESILTDFATMEVCDIRKYLDDYNIDDCFNKRELGKFAWVFGGT